MEPEGQEAEVEAEAGRKRAAHWAQQQACAHGMKQTETRLPSARHSLHTAEACAGASCTPTQHSSH